MNRPSTRRSFFRTGAQLAVGALAVSQAPSAGAIEPFQRPFGKQFKLSCAAYGYRKYLAGDAKKNIPVTMTIEQFLEECAKMGLHAAEPTAYYFPEPLTETFLIHFKRKAFLLGLDISGTAVGNTFTYPPGPQRDEQLAMVKRWIDHAAVMGAPEIRIFAGNVAKVSTPEQALQWSIETTRAACDYAGTRGVFLALENHGGIVSDAEGVLAIVRQVDSPWFGVNLDTGNFHTDDPYKEMEAIAPYAVNVQVKTEIQRRGEAKQEADFDRILDILGNAGYRGYIALEYEGDEEPKEAIPKHIEKLQNLIAQRG